MKTGPIGISFGNSNTVIALWDEASNSARSVQLRPFSQLHRVEQGNLAFIPSMIHFFPDGTELFGAQIQDKGLTHSERTVQSFIRNLEMAHGAEIDGHVVTYKDAAEKFVSKIISEAERVFAPLPEELAIAIPTADFEQQVEWYKRLDRGSKIFPRYIDKFSALICNWPRLVSESDVILFFDVGATTTTVSLGRLAFSPLK